MFVPRHETGLSSAGSVPLGATVVLAPAEGPIGAIGGTGKTQMAAAVTRELGRDYAVELVVWVAATSLDSVVCGYTQALRDVGVPAAPQSAEQAAWQFAAWLTATDRPWVVVLDDLREGAVPERLWPRGPAGRVLVTSSDPDAGARYGSAMRRVVSVGPFSAREAMSYLSAQLHTDSALRTGALELARDLGCWPLALAQAAAVMIANGIGCRELLWEGGCHPVLIQAGRSLRNADGRSVDCWGNLLAASEQELGPAHPHTILIREELATACEASGRPQDAIALYERILSEQEQTSADDEDQTGVARVALARVYHAVGRDGDAIRLAQGALADVEDSPGSQLDQLIAQEALARAYLAAGQVSEAVTGFRQVLAGRERAQGPDHPLTSTARGELAVACQAAGQHKEALALCQRVLADCERLHGPSHPSTLAARAGLASAYQTSAKPKRAIPLYQRTLADRERLQGRDHADTIAASGDLAAAYLSAGQLALAVSQYETALAACQRALGPAHELTRATNNGLNTAVARGVAVRGIDLRTRVP